MVEGGRTTGDAEESPERGVPPSPQPVPPVGAQRSAGLGSTLLGLPAHVLRRGEIRTLTPGSPGDHPVTGVRPDRGGEAPCDRGASAMGKMYMTPSSRSKGKDDDDDDDDDDDSSVGCIYAY